MDTSGVSKICPAIDGYGCLPPGVSVALWDVLAGVISSEACYDISSGSAPYEIDRLVRGQRVLKQQFEVIPIFGDPRIIPHDHAGELNAALALI